MDAKQNKVSDWLEKLQLESWNLELLISGFSIFLLIQVGSSIGGLISSIQHNSRLDANLMGMVFTFLGIIQLASVVLTCNLVAHVLLRGFWIGAIGLRSVQETIDISQLNYSAFFQEKLRGKIMSLDQLLTRLDNFSSIIFSFSFLIIFMLLSLFLGFSFLGVLASLIEHLIEPLEIGIFGEIIHVLTVVILLIFFFFGLIYMIDTLSLGFFKRFQRLSKIYYPIYKFYGFITLAGFYRGIYYSIITRFPKARIRLFLIVYLSIVFLLPFHKYDQYIFYPDNSLDEFKLSRSYYDDQREDSWITIASIPSRIINDNYIPLFINYNVQDNKDIQKNCPNFKPAKKEGIISGIKFRSGIQFSSPKVPEKEPQKLLNCLSGYYNIYLNDTLQTNLDFWFYMHPNKKEKGLLTTLDLTISLKGKNIIRISQNSFEAKEGKEIPKEIDLVSIPFWLDN